MGYREAALASYWLIDHAKFDKEMGKEYYEVYPLTDKYPLTCKSLSSWLREADGRRTTRIEILQKIELQKAAQKDGLSTKSSTASRLNTAMSESGSSSPIQRPTDPKRRSWWKFF